MIRVGVIGASGRMGRETCKAISDAPDMDLIFGVGLNASQLEEPDIYVSDDLPSSLMMKPDAVVDFTHPSVAANNAKLALEAGAHAIIGTSGLAQEDLDLLATKAKQRSACYIPNFAIGAVLMMKFAKEAAVYLPDCEIIEMHHEKKADAPSGTAIRTAHMVNEGRKHATTVPRTELVKHDGARGSEIGETHVHSVRLPGLLAHQMVIFGAKGESLTIRHDSMDRSSFMPGVLLAIRKSQSRTGLIVGLENLME